MNYSLFVSVIFFLCLAGSTFAQRGGSINITFTNENPVSSQLVAADISLGDSLEGTIILTPPPSKPLRFNIVSTIPQIIYPTHERVTFKTGQSEGVFGLLSDPTGSIGFVTVVISPEIPGTYVPLTFTVLVRGFASAALAADVTCVASQQATEIEVTLDPIAPEAVTIVAQTINGIVSPQVVTVPNGQNTAIFTFYGGNIAASSVTFTSPIYLPYTLRFNTLGQITTVKSSIITAGAPSEITVSVLPSNINPVAVTTTSTNLKVTPTKFNVPAQATAEVQVIGKVSGSASITYNALNYCPYTDFLTVNSAPICSTGYVPNFYGTSCALCPGNNAYIKFYTNSCFKHGVCSYSTCSTTNAHCTCNAPYVGYACQWNPATDYFIEVTINNAAFNISLDHVQQTAANVTFDVPSNFVSSNDVGGAVIVAPFSSNEIFINSSAVYPNSTSPTSIGWRFEVTCSDNTYDISTFGNSVGVVIPVDVVQLTQFDIALSNLYFYDVTLTSWKLASQYCASSQTYYNVDFDTNTISTAFCKPGQYNIFISPPPPLPANTGNSLNPFPAPNVVSGNTPTTGVTGSNPIPPPLPVFTVTAGDPSLSQKFMDNNLGNSSSYLRYSPLLLAILFLFL